MDEPDPDGEWFCPRSCSIPGEDFSQKTRAYLTLEDVKKHVREQHPDHDPLWFETYPEENGLPNP